MRFWTNERRHSDLSLQPGQSRAGTLETLLVVLPLVLLLVLGMWMPGPLQTALNAAADVIRHVGPALANSSGGATP